MCPNLPGAQRNPAPAESAACVRRTRLAISTSASSSGAPSGYLAKVQTLARHNFFPRTHQRLPKLFFPGGTQPGQQHLDPSSQKLPRGGIVRAQPLRAAPAAMPKQPCRQHPGVVEDHQVARPQHSGNSLNTRSRSAPPSKCNIREEARSAGGCCAIRSGGSTKSKSETSTEMIIGREKD